MKYIANFDIPENSSQQRSINLAAANVMAYIGDVLNEIEPLQIISPTRTLSKKGFYNSKKILLKNGAVLRLPFTIGTSSKLGRLISIFLVQLWLIGILLFGCKRGETIVVYHSISLIPVIKFIQRIKKFNLILEIREIYSDINWNVNKETELQYFDIACGDRFGTSL